MNAAAGERWTLRKLGLVVDDRDGKPVLYVAASRSDHVDHGPDWHGGNAARIGRLAAAAPELRDLVDAAGHALRSYQYGNAAPDLAAEMADACEAALKRIGGPS